MFLEVIRSEGLSHLSYLLGDGEWAAVIDPRRDCDVYLERAHRRGARIRHVFETHRNEDYVIGSCDLAARSGASIHHGAADAFDYGNTAAEGDRFRLGTLELRVLETPGHTDESLSFALYDTAFSAGEAVAVFTGDALFIGDVGRTDFYPDRAHEVAAALYHSIHHKLLPLGDQALLYPAHGAGSICGSGMASREFSTLGYERRYNPALQLDRDAFIARKCAERHYQPPYFRHMERVNRAGPPAVAMPRPRPCSADEFAAAMDQGLQVLDVRAPEAVAGALIPGSLAIPLDMLAGFAGWYFDAARPIGLVADGHSQAQTAARRLLRLGYEDIPTYLDEGLHAWEVTGRDYQTVPALHAKALRERQESGTRFTLLDVRGHTEVAQTPMPDATHIYVGELPAHLAEVPAARPITTFCGSGKRSIIAASILLRHGFRDVEVCLGSLAACRAVGCRIGGSGPR